MYTLKNIKQWEGMDGYGLNADLYREGKKVARIHDAGNGGEPIIYMVPGADKLGFSIQDFQEWCMCRDGMDGHDINWAWQFWLAGEVNHHERRKVAMRVLRKASYTVGGKLYGFKGQYGRTPWSKLTPMQKESLRRHVQQDGGVLLNDMPKEKAIEAAMEVL